jgi:hypothetical protein
VSRRNDHRSLTYAASGGQVLGSGVSKGQQSIDDRGLTPPPVICGEPLPLFDSNHGADTSARDIYGLGGRPALREPCSPKAAGGLELVGLAQGNVILVGSTFRREKTRLDPCTGTSITAQSRCSSTSPPPLIAHSRPALPE